MEKFKIFHESLSEIEYVSNAWLSKNNIIIKDINTTAMNCKWCGKSIMEHLEIK